MVDDFNERTYNTIILQRGNSMTLSQRLTQIRKQMGLSQEEFGALFDVSRQAVSKWELGQSKPDIDVLLSISKKMNISLDVLLDNDIGANANESHLNKVLANKHRMLFGILLLSLGIVGFMFLYVDIHIVSNISTMIIGMWYMPMHIPFSMLLLVLVFIGVYHIIQVMYPLSVLQQKLLFLCYGLFALFNYGYGFLYTLFILDLTFWKLISNTPYLPYIFFGAITVLCICACGYLTLKIMTLHKQNKKIN